MYKRILLNDFKKTKVTSLTMMTFVAVATMLVSFAAILIVNLTSSLEHLMDKSKTPHFMQMHVGEINQDRLNSFAEQHPNVEEMQIVEFLGIDGSLITLGDYSLEHSVQDHGLSVQNESFDFLLNLDGEKIQVKEGEIYLPVTYMNETKIGDVATISGKDFTIVGYLRDSMMNSTLSSSKRFLVSEKDFNELASLGTREYLIEFRLIDYEKIGEFETDYAAAGLEANGPAVTYGLFQMMNAISFGILIAVILLVSILVVGIALICIRFTILATLEDDYREIGVMKAIGLPFSHIRKIYLTKYVGISLIGSVLGLILSFIFKGFLLENITLYFGEAESSFLGELLGIMGVFLVLIVILSYVYFVLRRFNNVSVTEALRFGVAEEKLKGTKRFTLANSKLLNKNIFLGIKDVFSRRKLYVTNMLVLLFATFILIVPLNLYDTIQSKNFTQYMGIGSFDVRIQTQTKQEAEQIVERITQDKDINEYAVLTTSMFSVKKKDGTEENIKIELGDHHIFPISYLEGREPIGEDEISLSQLNAEEMEIKVGDQLFLMIDGIEKTMTITGIYSDITNGGKTAKATFSPLSEDSMWTVISLTLINPEQISEKVKNLSAQFPFAKVVDVEDFVNQTFGSTINAVKIATIIASGIAIGLTLLITMMFMNMLVSKDKYSNAVLKSIGFTNKDINLQYITRSVFVLLVAIIVGMVLANTLGEKLVGGIISSFGVASFEFILNPVEVFVFIPIMLAVTVLIGTFVVTSRAGKMNLDVHLKE